MKKSGARVTNALYERRACLFLTLPFQVCCQEKLCSGCSRLECECKHGPVRGNYDGLVVLACLTRDTTPRSGPGKLDQEDLALMLEYGLTVHFMQHHDPGLCRAVVHTGRDVFLQVRIRVDKMLKMCIILILGAQSQTRKA